MLSYLRSVPLFLLRPAVARTVWMLWLIAAGFCGIGPAFAQTVTVAVAPRTVTLTHGESQQFVAAVSGTTNTAVTWSINSVGSITSNGLYTAPASLFQTMTVTVTARSAASPTVTGTATITLVPSVQVTAVTPSSVTLNPGQTQQFTATLTGTTNTDVTWALTPQVGNITTTGLYTAPAAVTIRQTITVTAISVADPQRSRSATITLQAGDPLSVTINPSSATLAGGQTEQFTATVANADNTAVRWSISPSVGTISDSGLYTAPAVITGTQTVRVTATSLADPTKSATATISLGTQLTIGTGAPNEAIAFAFRVAFNRGDFRLLVSSTPAGQVRRFGTAGYVQEFSDINGTGARYALVMPEVIVPAEEENTLAVFQIRAPLFAYYNTVGAATAGYPRMDSNRCPLFDSSNACEWALFDKSYALFAYANSLATGQTFTIRNNFYTRWFALGGINGLGRPVSGEEAVTATNTSTATAQTFAGGAVYQYTNGPNNGKYFSVAEPLYSLYLTNGGPRGRLGFPTADEVTLPSGLRRQSFQGGALEYTPGSEPTLRLPVSGIGLASSSSLNGTINLNLGDAVTVTAKPVADAGVELTGRTVSWSTTNSRVISIQATNEVAVLRAAGGGVASVTASCEGVVSARLNFQVTAPCCQVGEGAPPGVQQSFQDALARYRLSVALPAAVAASRVGNGYVQVLQSSDAANPVVFLLAKSDRLGTAYLVGGEILKRYQELGGPGGSLGYPSSDATAGGRQVFENGVALAGNPVRPVSGLILTKWAQLGYETGAAGAPIADPVAFATFGANSGFSQAFSRGAIYAAVNGPRTGGAHLVGGLILARYSELGGAAGPFGMPISEEFASGDSHQQNFEGGSIDYKRGDSAAAEHAAEKQPAVLVSPSSAVAGSRVRVAVLGFPARSPIRVSLTGQQDFLVNNEVGAYSWELFIPLSTSSRTLEVRATDTRSAAAASGTITIKGLAENRVQIVKVSGDSQTGLPGALLQRPLRIALKDGAGGAVIGAPVRFEASPGARVSVASAFTDQNGETEVFLRLPSSEGVALVTVDSPNIALNPVTFGARAASSSLSNFPKLLATGAVPVGNGPATIAQKGALLAAVASMLRYHQNSGELAAPNGVADPGALNEFLKRFCAPSPAGTQVCDGFVSNPDGGDQVVNLWRAAEFAGPGADPVVAVPDLTTVADWLGQGSPVLLSLAVTAAGAPAGGHFVVATGVNSDGGLAIHDPALPSRIALSDYLNGFTSGGVQWKGALRGIARFALRTPAAGRFLLAAPSQPADTLDAMSLDVQSAAGACGVPLDLPDAAQPAAGITSSWRISRFVVCDGAQPAYQMTVGAARAFRASIIDLGGGGSPVDLSGAALSAYEVSRRGGALALSPLRVNFTAEAVVNAATFKPGLAPGSLMAIFGAGLGGSKSNTSVEMNGEALRVISTSAFQINAEVPLGLAPGVHALSVRSDLGSMSQPVEIREAAPAIFLLGTAGAGALVNQNGAINGPSSPISRGQVLTVYATGLGAVRPSGSLSVTSATVTARLNGADLPVAFAGLAPGFIGLYQVNVPIPGGTLPGLELPFAIRVGSVVSDPVSVSIQ